MSALVINGYPTTDSVSSYERANTIDSRGHRKCEQINDENVSKFLCSIQSLLLKYKMYSKSPSSQVSSGGLQQFITRKLQRKSDQGNSGYSLTLTQRLKALYSREAPIALVGNITEEACFIQYLPIDLKLYIFSFLDARSLCMACCVNQEWRQLTCDNLLWHRLLQQDMKLWSRMSHVTNPYMYQEVNSEWSQKDIYLRCSPVFHEQLRQSNSTFHHVSSVLKYLMPKKVPKVAMFGPGLEQSTSGIVRSMLYADNPTYTRVAMFPGQFDGVGGGITLKLLTGHSLHLSVLYSASKQERENRGAQDRLQQHRMLMQRQAGEDAAEGDHHYELKPQIKHLCQTLDGFIFVIDASEAKESIASSCDELMAMIRERKSAPHVPLLILSCVKQDDSHRLPVCDVVEILQLSSISQPWLVIDCVTDTLNSVDIGITWLVDQAQYK